MSETTYSHLLIMGDFNCPLINWSTLSSPNSGFSQSLLHLTIKLSLTQHVSFPTKFRPGLSPSCLDLIFTNEPSMIDTVRSLPPLGKSDHVVLSWDFVCEWSTSTSSLPSRNFAKADFNLLRSYLTNFDWFYLYTLSIDAAFF